MSRNVVILGRFNGPPRSANGGYACGVVSETIEGTATARLHLPPPLDRAMTLDGDGRSGRLMDGETLVAEAATADLDMTVPSPPSLDEAKEAVRRYVGFDEHQFPTCYVCGPERVSNDGLQIFPGPIGDGSVVATPWTPDGSLLDRSGKVERRHIWAALDCPTYFAIAPAPPALLAQLTVEIDRLPELGEPLVVMGWQGASEGRKHNSHSALATAEGEVIAKGDAIWIEPREWHTSLGRT